MAITPSAEVPRYSGKAKAVERTRREASQYEDRLARGLKAMQTARAHGKVPPPEIYQCNVPSCRAPFTAARSQRRSYQRCPTCVERGRAKCSSCDAEISVRPGAPAPRKRCEECRASNRHGPDRAPRIVLTCRGVEAFRSVRHAKTCPHTRVLAPGQLAALSPYSPETGNGYDSATNTYRSQPCTGLANVVRVFVKRAKEETGEVIQSWEQLKEIQQQYGRTFIDGVKKQEQTAKRRGISVRSTGWWATDREAARAIAQKGQIASRRPAAKIAHQRALMVRPWTGGHRQSGSFTSAPTAESCS